MRFNFVAGNAAKIEVSELFLFKKNATLIYETHSWSYLVVIRNYSGALFGGGQKTFEMVMKRCKNRGFRDFWVVMKGRITRDIEAFKKWAACTRSIMGCLCCAT